MESKQRLGDLGGSVAQHSRCKEVDGIPLLSWYCPLIRLLFGHLKDSFLTSVQSKGINKAIEMIVWWEAWNLFFCEENENWSCFETRMRKLLPFPRFFFWEREFLSVFHLNKMSTKPRFLISIERNIRRGVTLTLIWIRMSTKPRFLINIERNIRRGVAQRKGREGRIEVWLNFLLLRFLIRCILTCCYCGTR